MTSRLEGAEQIYARSPAFALLCTDSKQRTGLMVFIEEASLQ